MPPATTPRDALSERAVRAFLLDLDGVITPTAAVHRRAWERLFARYLDEHGAEPYVDEVDYFAHIDGKPRYDGVRDLLSSRGIRLPEGSPGDAPDAETVCGLGNRKNAEFNAVIAEEGVAPYPATSAFIDAAEAAGYRLAVVSSSKNTPEVLRAAGLEGRFPVIVDGNVAAAEGIAGKPAPDTYSAAAARLNLPNELCAVVEDAESGVRAGAAGGFAVVIGVDRGLGHDRLLSEGADIVVDELDELLPLRSAHPAHRLDAPVDQTPADREPIEQASADTSPTEAPADPASAAPEHAQENPA